MRQSILATKTLREAPKDEQSINAILLARAGYIDKLSAGIYSFLPLGLRVLRKIENIIREEMIAAGGQEILMPALQPKEVWETTGRWENFDALFKLKGISDKNYALGATHEEIITPLSQKLIFSYKDLPLYLFQIQTKFRNEPRAKSGLLRTREFSMKDLYSFHTTQEELESYYEKMIETYLRVFERCGLKEKTYLTAASGGAFSKYSHEFQTISESGEDTIYICQKCGLAINKEIKDENPTCPKCANSDFEEKNAIEVGNIFKLGTKFSESFNLKFKNQRGQEQLVIMGCYGIGLSRLIGTIVEIFHDEKGLIWPESVAPFKIHLLSIGDDEKIKQETEKIYQELISKNTEVLFDDRAVSAGGKLTEADLLGIPNRVVVSKKTLEQNSLELKKRSEEKTEMVNIEEIVKRLS